MRETLQLRSGRKEGHAVRILTYFGKRLYDAGRQNDRRALESEEKSTSSGLMTDWGLNALMIRGYLFFRNTA